MSSIFPVAQWSGGRRCLQNLSTEFYKSANNQCILTLALDVSESRLVLWVVCRRLKTLSIRCRPWRLAALVLSVSESPIDPGSAVRPGVTMGTCDLDNKFIFEAMRGRLLSDEAWRPVNGNSLGELDRPCSS